jgi:phosphate transport system protein
MPRTVLERELQNLHTQILQLGSLVEKALAETLTSLQTSDFTAFRGVIEADVSIDSLCTAIEAHVIRLLTLLQPLAGRDLRYLTAAVSIAGRLERIGHEAAGIAEMSLRMPRRESTAPELTNMEEDAPETLDGYVGREDARSLEVMMMKHLLALGAEARRVLQETLKAFAHNDAEGAKHLREEDELVDRRYETIQYEVLFIFSIAPALPDLQRDASFLQHVAYLLWMAHKLERVANHATKVCKKLIYIVEG